VPIDAWPSVRSVSLRGRRHALAPGVIGDRTFNARLYRNRANETGTKDKLAIGRCHIRRVTAAVRRGAALIRSGSEFRVRRDTAERVGAIDDGCACLPQLRCERCERGDSCLEPSLKRHESQAIIAEGQIFGFLQQPANITAQPFAFGRFTRPRTPSRCRIASRYELKRPPKQSRKQVADSDAASTSSRSEREDRKIAPASSPAARTTWRKVSTHGETSDAAGRGPRHPTPVAVHNNRHMQGAPLDRVLRAGAAIRNISTL